MSKALVSIVIPVYNTHRYVASCVDSLKRQTDDTWEIILVDDGSTDGISGRVCDEIAESDDRITVIHQENSGLSGARNTGLTHARGEFVVFIDSDDSVQPEFIATLRGAIGECDLAAVGIIDRYSDKDEINVAKVDRVISYDEFFKLTLLGEVPGSVCNRMYRKDAIKGLRFREGKYYEDAFFTADGVGTLGCVALHTEPLYVYSHRESSITTEPYSPRALHVIEAARHAVRQAEQQAPHVIQAAHFRLLSAHFVVLDRMLQSQVPLNDPELTTIVSYLRSHARDVMTSPTFHYTRKIAMAALLINVRCYHALVTAKSRSRRLGN